jgi:hypothetical protein
MSLKEKVDNYFKTTKRKRRKHYFIMLEDFWRELDCELNRMDKKKRYYPDFFIKDENIIIEVKSKYTYEVELEKNKLKEKASREIGFNYRLIIYEN